MTSQDAQELLRRYLTGDCTVKEEQLLESWYRELHDEFPWEMPAEQSAAIHDRMLSKVREELGEQAGAAQRVHSGQQGSGQQGSGRVRRIGPMYRRRYAAVAAAVLIVLAGGWGWWMHSHQRPAAGLPAIAIEAKPGGNHAILTLGNGQQVVLDSTANGMLAMQGNNRVIKQDDQLDYRPGSGTTAASATASVLNTLATPRGGQYRLILPDGTKVWLDASSSISYPSAFVGKKRAVSITGQAYFEVVHNPKMPFEVEARGQVIHDIGTAFNINAYGDEPAMKITLVNGTVTVAAKGQDIGLPKGNDVNVFAGVMLVDPGQQAEYRDGELRLAPNADLTAVLAWKNGMFALTHADIGTIMREISRWYDVEIQFEKGVPDGHITGDVPRNTMLSTTLQVLQTSGVHFKVEEKKIVVTP